MLDENFIQALFEALIQKTNRNFDGYEKPLMPPKVKIPGEVAFFLDDLLDHAENNIGQDRAEAFAEVVDYGIAAWYGNLGSEVLESLGLPSLAPEEAAPSAESDARLKSKSLEELNKELEATKVNAAQGAKQHKNEKGDLESQIAQLNKANLAGKTSYQNLRKKFDKTAAELESIREEQRSATAKLDQINALYAEAKAEIDKLKKEAEAMDSHWSASDPNPAQAQAASDVRNQSHQGYTPMTYHSLDSNKNQNRASKKNKNNQRRRHRPTRPPYSR